MPAGEDAVGARARCRACRRAHRRLRLPWRKPRSPRCFTSTTVLFKRMRTGEEGSIEPGIIGTGQHDIGGGVSGNRCRNQLADQQTRDRSIAVGKVEEVFLRFWRWEWHRGSCRVRERGQDSGRRSRDSRGPRHPARTPRRCPRRTRVGERPDRERSVRPQGQLSGPETWHNSYAPGALFFRGRSVPENNPL